MPRRRPTAAAPLAAALEACEPRRLFSVVAPAFADKIGLNGVVDYDTTFEDNFNGSSIDKTKWQVRDGHRWRAYRDAPVSTFSYTDESPIQVGNGELQLIAHNDAKTGQLKGAFLQTGRQFDDNSKNSPVPPAKLTPGYSGDFEQTYGYWETRAKFSSLPGMWSAFWVHSYRMVEVRDDAGKANQPGVFGTEYDVVEHQAIRRGSPALQDVTQIVHANGYGNQHKAQGYYTNPAKLNPSKTGPEQYHVYGMLWTQTAVKFYIDGNMVGATADPALISSVPQMALLSVEVGAGGSNENGKGANSAGVTPAGGYGSKQASKARATFDYVRVWKLKGQAAPTGNASAGGTVFVDKDADGIRDAGEAGRSGVTVWADYDKDGVRDSGEPYAVTNASGVYRIDNIAPKKSIDLRIVTPGGAKIVAPDTGKLSYATFPGRFEAQRDFAISAAGTTAPPPTTPTQPTKPTTPTQPTTPAPATAKASGAVYVDTDGDGTRDANEPFRAGAVVYVDANANGVRDAGERSWTTGADGGFTLGGLAANVAVQVRIVAVSGFTLRTPAAGYYAYKPTAGQANATFHFGLRPTAATPPTPAPPKPTTPTTPGTPATPKPTPPAANSPTVSSFVFIDKDGDGVRDPGEVGRAGAIVFVDANYNGRRDADELWATTAADGSFRIAGLPLNKSVFLMLVPVAGYKQTLPSGGYAFKTYAGMLNTRTTFGLRPA